MTVTELPPFPPDRSDRILDQVADAAHPLFAAWRAACGNSFPDHWAVAYNLAMDPRVDDPAYAASLCSGTATLLNGGSLNDGLKENLGTVYQPPFPSWRCAGTRVNLPGHRRLFHVDSFSSLIFRLTTATGMGRGNEFQDVLQGYFGTTRFLPAHGKPDQRQIDTLAEQINSLDADEFRSLIADFLLLSPPRGIWWAALADETKAYRADARAVASALGLGVYSDGVWLLGYDYPATNAGLVYRPTAFEAADYAFHFPSPTSMASGLTMPLDDRVRPCAEFVHHALAPLVAAEHALPRLMRIEGWTADGRRNYESLLERRKRHWTFLRKRAGVDAAWVGRHQWRDEGR